MNCKRTRCTVVLYSSGKQYRYWLTWFGMISFFLKQIWQKSSGLLEELHWPFQRFSVQSINPQQNRQDTTLLCCSSFSCLSQITQSTHIIATGGISIVEGSWTHGILPCFLHRYLYDGFWGPVHSQETDSSCVKM